MRYILLFGLICCLLFANCKKEPQAPPPPVIDTPAEPTYKLVWADEFNYSGLPKDAFWSYEVGKVRNQEEQFYVPGNLLNSQVKDGVLVITGIFDSSSATPITSASIITKDKVEFLYGRIEASAKLPSGKGTWPAVWTMGINRGTVGWPACGEIDIMESLGFVPDYIFGSLHKANGQNTDEPLFGPYQAPPGAIYDGFHKYAIEWDSTEISFFFDTVKYVTYKAADMTPSEWSQFQKPHYLLLNLALGGESGGAIDSSKFPFVYAIDYVRYYKKM
jgi:beta-glucanase (GH16 family)